MRSFCVAYSDLEKIKKYRICSSDDLAYCVDKKTSYKYDGETWRPYSGAVFSNCGTTDESESGHTELCGTTVYKFKGASDESYHVYFVDAQGNFIDEPSDSGSYYFTVDGGVVHKAGAIPKNWELVSKRLVKFVRPDSGRQGGEI